MIINVAVVDDNKSFNRVFEILLSSLKLEGVTVKVDSFSSPLEYKESKKSYDIAVLDCIFKGYPTNENGINLAEFTKKRDKDTKVVLTSEFANNEFVPIIMEKSKHIDLYCDKNLSENNMIEDINRLILEIKDKKMSNLDSVKLKLHAYKIGKEDFSFKDINYAKTENREKHLITVGTTRGNITLSMTVNSFVKKLNDAIIKNNFSFNQKKSKTDLYINSVNIMEKKNKSIMFKDGSSLDI